MRTWKYIAIVLFAFLIALWHSAEDLDSHQESLEEAPDVSREEVLGSWISAAKQQNKSNSDSSPEMSAFELKYDSTAIIFWGEREVDGRWKWKSSKKIGSDILGFSVNSDVILMSMKDSTHSDIKGFKLGKKNDELFLRVGDEDYKKQ